MKTIATIFLFGLMAPVASQTHKSAKPSAPSSELTAANAYSKAIDNFIKQNPQRKRVSRMLHPPRKTFLALIVNSGFEAASSLAPWVLSGQVVRSTGAYPHSGVAYMILGAVNSSTETLYQTVTIPSGGANLNFWLNVTSSEAVFDRLFIEVRSTSGTPLATLATFSDQNKGTAGVYVLRGPYNLGAFAGQTVRIQFRATEDLTLPTSFRVDDVSVK